MNNKFIKDFIKYFENYSIYFILLFGFILRFRGMDFGLPYLYNPDEPTFVNPPINMLVTGDLNPHWFGHPGSFIMYLLLPLFFIYFIFGLLFGYIHNLSEFRQFFTDDPTIFFLSGRLLMIFFAIITLYLVYLVAKNLFNKPVGLLASFLLAISPLHIGNSRLVRTDITATMLIMLSLYFLLKFFNQQNKNTKLLIFSSLFAGFSIATKYTSGIIIFPILIHCLVIDSKQKYILKNEKPIKYSLIGLGVLLILFGIFVDFSYVKGMINNSLLLLITIEISLILAILYFINPFNLKIKLSKATIFRILLILFVIFIVFSWIKTIENSNAPADCEPCKIVINNALLLPITAGISIILVSFYCINLLNSKPYISKAILFIFIGFFIFAPFVILDPFHAIKDIIRENRGTHLGAESLPGIQNYIWYLKNALQKGMGGLFFELFAGLGLSLIIYKKSYEKYLFLIFPFLYFLIIGSMRLRWDRWFIPLLPFEAIFFGFGFYYSYKYIIQIKTFQDFKSKIFPLPTTQIIFSLFAIMIVFASLQPIINDINSGTKLSKTDTTTIAKEWIESNLPSGSKIAYEQYAPQLHINPHGNFTLMNLGWDKIVSKPLSYYKNQSVEYIIITSSFKNRYYNEPDKYTKEISRYEELKNGAELIKMFKSKENPGPVIEIYRLK